MKTYPFSIFYQEHRFALEQGDPCLGTVDAETETQAILKAAWQGIGGTRAIVASYIPHGMCMYRDTRTGRVKAIGKRDNVWYPFCYFDDTGGTKARDPEIVRLHLHLRIQEMQERLEEYPDWEFYKQRLQDFQRLFENPERVNIDKSPTSSRR